MTDTAPAPSTPAPDLNWWEVPLWKWRNDRSETDTKSEVDYQRQRVYDAENASGIKSAPQRHFNNLAECQVYINYVCGSVYFKRRFGEFVVVAESKASGAALGSRHGPNKGKVYLPRWAFNEHIILHEMAHCLTPPQSGGGHGRRWCKAYMDLVGYHLGRAWETKLRQAFIKHGVKTTPKRPPNVIGERCAALRSQYYTKTVFAKVEPADDTFPETTEEVCIWIEQQSGWNRGDVGMKRILVPGCFEFTKAPGMKRPFRIDVFRLADLTYSEWTEHFRAELAKQ